MSLSLSAFRLFFRSAQAWRVRRKPGPAQLDALIARLTKLDPVAHSNTKFEEINGTRCALIGDQYRAERCIVFLHGGGFALCGVSSHIRFISFLSDATKSCIVFPEYTKTPHAIYPRQLNECLAVFDFLKKENTQRELILMGDSAGGNLVAAVILSRIKNGEPLPHKVVMMSPWLDLTGKILDEAALASDDIFTREEVHRYAAMYYAENDAEDPLISPVNAAYPTNLTTLLLTTRNELFFPIIKKFEEANKNPGLRYIERDGLFHVWPLFTGVIPEATKDARLIADFINEKEIEN